MPVDRLLHPCIGDSEKIARLTDMEFRVWITYLLTADDFGVMPMLASKIQGAERTLGARRRQQVDRALEVLVDVGLVRRFDHQGQAFLFSPAWQKYQKMRYPRQSHYPRPNEIDVELCDTDTAELFQKHNGPIATSTYKENSGNSPRLLRASTRETAKGKRLEAEGQGLTRERFEAWWTEYPRKVGKDAAWREWLQRSPSAELAGLMVAKVLEQRASAQWLKDGGQFIPHPRTWLHQGRWQDEGPATKPERQIWTCRHLEECSHQAMCEHKNNMPHKYPKRAEAEAS